jgi:RluA family pseudouridine synthase
VVHRIDRETSGLVVMAKTAEAHRALNAAFSAREVAKGYCALVWGAPPRDEGVVEVSLVPARKGRMRPAAPGESGLAAITRWRLLARDATASLVAFEPLTGRQHQIRVHARELGCAILGDRLYAPRAVREAAPRLMLHAERIRFRHPKNGSEAEFRSPLHPDFDLVRQRLAER